MKLGTKLFFPIESIFVRDGDLLEFVDMNFEHMDQLELDRLSVGDPGYHKRRNYIVSLVRHFRGSIETM